MDEAIKKRVTDAIGKYVEKNTPKVSVAKKKNGKPEKELVEEPCAEWMRNRGWSINIIEAKATYSESAGRYIAQSVAPGFVDCVGNTDKGRAVFVEFKAPGKIRTLSNDQRKFLVNKIKTGCFAVVVDSVEKLEKYWNDYASNVNRQDYLLTLLPDCKADKMNDDSPLFE